MKKILVWLIAIAMMLVFCGCNVSQENVSDLSVAPAEMNTVSCADELNTFFTLNSAFGAESRRQLLRDLPMSMDVYMQLEDITAVYELYGHQHHYTQNDEIAQAQQGVISATEQEIREKYTKEYQQQYTQYHAKVKETLGQQYNDCNRWFAAWKELYKAQPMDGEKTSVSQSESAQDRYSQYLQEKVKADAAYEKRLQEIGNTLRYSTEQLYYIDQLFDDYAYICQQAYTVYERRIEQFGVEQEPAYMARRQNTIETFKEETRTKTTVLLGEEYDAFEPYFDEMIRLAQRPYFFKNVTS